MFASASLLGLCLATLGLPVLFVALQRLDVGPPSFTAARLRLGVGLQWGVALLVAVFVLVVEGRPLASVGVTFDPLTFLGGAVLAWVLAAGLYAATLLVAQYRGTTLVDSATVLLYAQPTRWKVLIAVTTGVTEEFLYRGYLVERTLELGVAPVLAGALSVVAFLAAHLPGRDLRTVLVSLGPVSVGFVLAYFLVRSVPAVAVAHVTINLHALYGTSSEDVLDAVDRDRIDDRVLRRLDAE